MSKRTWTPEQTKILIKKYPLTPTPTLAKELGKTRAAVKTRATSLKIKKILHSHSPYTLDKLKYLIENYTDTLNKDLAKKLGVSVVSIQAKAHKLGLKKSKEFFLKHSSKTFFQKGGIPKNKGKKQVDYMSAQAIERTKATRFQKGSKPHNWKPIGSKRITQDGYTEVKILNPNKWQLQQRLIYEKLNKVKITKGFNVIFLNGNQQDFSIDNLALISNAQLMSMNTIHRYPAAVKELIRLRSKLIKTIDNEN